MMLNAKAAAALLGLSVRAVYAIPDRDLPRYRVGAGRGAVRFDPSDVQTYRLRCRSDGTHATGGGGLSSTALSMAVGTDLAACFRRAGVRPKLTPTTDARAGTCTPLRLVSSAETR